MVFCTIDEKYTSIFGDKKIYFFGIVRQIKKFSFVLVLTDSLLSINIVITLLGIIVKVSNIITIFVT
jgi:hypothetical protein